GQRRLPGAADRRGRGPAGGDLRSGRAAALCPRLDRSGRAAASLAHALAHALQDQRFGLLRLLKVRMADAPGLDFDARLARQALIEGDAGVLAMEATDARGL